MANLDVSYDVDNRTKAFESHGGGVLVCLAGPGTGKTYSLLARTAALTTRSHPADSICYLTFIKEISKAFADDYIQRFGEAALKSGPRITTLHSFACRLLRNQGFRVGYDGHLSFCNVTEAGDAGQTFLEDLFPLVPRGSCRTPAQLRDPFGEIKAAWRDGIDPRTLPEPASSILEASLTLLRCYRLVDWDQTIPTAHSLLLTIDDLPDWITKIRHYFVDEYQDFNRAEQAVIEFLANHAESLVVVGNDDQSLYSGRGGSPEGIRNLYADPRYDRVSLTKCYRCPAAIVARTNTFQASMGGTARPMVASKAGGEVLSYRFKSSKTEVAFIANYLRARLAELPGEPKSKDGIVCLFPSKRILDAYFDMLSPSILCARRKSAVFPTRSLLALVLQLLLRPGQRYLERLLLRQYQDIKPRHRKLIVDRIMERDISPSVASRTLVEDGLLTNAAAMAANSFVALCTAVVQGDLAFAAHFLSESLHIGVDDTIVQLKHLHNANDGDSEDLVATICDVLLPDTASQPEDPRAVLFLTIHGSKGLTKRTVVIPGLEEAHLPGEAAGTELAEKMRLFFVALSRSTEHLLLTFPHNRGGNDRLNFKMAAGVLQVGSLRKQE